MTPIVLLLLEEGSQMAIKFPTQGILIEKLDKDSGHMGNPWARGILSARGAGRKEQTGPLAWGEVTAPIQKVESDT